MSRETFTVTIRHMEARDTAYVAELEKKVFSQPWSEKAFRDTIDNDDYIYIVAEHENSIVGYAGCIVSADGADITNIAVAGDYRRMGIAEELLRQTETLVRKRQVQSIYLEVRQSNTGARRLYEKNGFAQIGVRRNFYQKPLEDALLMAKNLQ